MLQSQCQKVILELESIYILYQIITVLISSFILILNRQCHQNINLRILQLNNNSIEMAQPNKSSSKKSVTTKEIKIEENKETFDNETDISNNSDRKL